MRLAIQKYYREGLAIAALMLLAFAIGGFILANQRVRFPFEEKPMSIEAELPDAQAVVPGQGQTVRIAGVRVGDVGGVRLEDGRAVVKLEIERKFLPVHKDATALLRPRTGLKDMFVELDPGSPQAGEMDEGDRIPVENSATDIDLDEILSSLDRDTRD
jgi:phospholipid/cholesterol/gamma-HCH transport system substrate-binding protein